MANDNGKKPPTPPTNDWRTRMGKWKKETFAKSVKESREDIPPSSKKKAKVVGDLNPQTTTPPSTKTKTPPKTISKTKATPPIKMKGKVGLLIAAVKHLATKRAGKKAKKSVNKTNEKPVATTTPSNKVDPKSLGILKPPTTPKSAPASGKNIQTKIEAIKKSATTKSKTSPTPTKSKGPER